MVGKVPKNLFNQRSGFLTAFLLLFLVLIVGRLFSLQIINGQAAREEAAAQHGIYRKLLPSRGEIKLADKFSVNTVTVAANLKSYLVYAVPQDIANPELAAAGLASVLDLDSKEVLAKITQKDKKYVPLKKQLTEEQQQKIKDLALPGIYFDSEDTRFYPEKNLLSQTLGFVGYKGSAKSGLYGLERYFDSDLAGTAGELIAEKDSSGALIFGSNKENRPEQDGVDLILTVDKNIQFQVENVLKDTVSKNGADSGTVIVVNPKTGSVLAIANYPDFDPNLYNKVENPKDFTNDAVTGNYEPGSIFKPLTMAAAINEGKVTPDTTYVDTGQVVESDGKIIKNADNKVYGLQNMTQVLDESINTGAVFAKEQIGNQKFYEYLKNFGLGQATGIELPETKGNLDNLKANIAINYDTASFGQGITATPIQMVQAFTALANNGKMMKPYLVQSKIYPDGKVENTKPQVVKQVISDKTANMVSAMLVSVVENGHGKKAGVPGYYIAGKTGTAQVARKDGKGYEENNNIGTFLGYGPVEDPQFLMLVRINHPRDVKYAEVTAAPAWGEIAQFILNYYHIAPTRTVGK
ncbi:MAG: penicillin-binding protein 2 [Candidatus Doudnabacteria bacterium]|nr:penicillin-binding protein 2 [Candidatus Doudnabacteria bacterium]